MKPTTSHSYKLQEIPSRRTYNSKTFYHPDGQKFITEFHVKPIHYVNTNGELRDLDEIASYFGNERGMILKEGWESKVDMGYLAWYLKRQKLIKGRGIMLPYSRIPLYLNTTSTFFPDPNPETTSVDGIAAYAPASPEAWATVRGAAGNQADDDSASLTLVYIDGATTNWDGIRRAFYLFDTSSIPDTDTISSATLSIYITTVTDNFSQLVSMCLTAPASNTAIVAGDYANITFTRQATDVDLTGMTTNAYNDWTLNATGLGNISKTGVSKFGLIMSGDMDNSEPTNANLTASFVGAMSETAGTTQDPKLVIVHSDGAVVAGNDGGLLMGV